MNREEWLTLAIQKIEQAVFNPLDKRMPKKWKATCGWVKGASAHAIGVCVDPICTKDGTTHIFVMPTQENSMEVLGTLTHEMIHAIVGVDAGHKEPFKFVVKKLQMSKPMTKSHPVAGTPLWTKLEQILLELGPYPHAAVVPRKKPTKPHGWARWKSVKEEKYTVLANTKKVAKFGMPRDPWGFEMVPVDPSKIFGVHPDPRQKDLFELPGEPDGTNDSNADD
jgi:hypothetical protein